MKNVLCYGDSNTWGCPPVTSLDDIPRYGFTERWPGVLRQELGADWWVIEEGLGGRTTVWDDAIEGKHKNGLTYLWPCLQSHQPVDLVAVMLGTNDLKKRFSVTAYDIAAGAEALVRLILSSGCGPSGGSPQVLLICPPPIAQLNMPALAEMFEDATEKSHKLAAHYEAVAHRNHVAFLNAGEVIVSSDMDGIHFAASEHQKLGKAVAERVRMV